MPSSSSREGASNTLAENDKKQSTATNTALSASQYIRTLAELSKFRLSALVVTTTSAGFFAYAAIATPLSAYSLSTLTTCCIGTALCSSSAATFNQIFEADRDARMKRTRHRPIPSGRIDIPHATILASVMGASGATLLAFGTDPLTTALGVGNIALYSGLYTCLKTRSELNTWVGAVVGAVPPIMGWTAAGGSPLDIEAMFLGGILYLWQMPHFFALSWMHRVDYARGGFQMVPVNDGTGDRTSALITRYTWYLSALPFLSTVVGVTSSMFALEGVALNAYALHVAYRFDGERSNANARKVFLTSLWYLPCWMMLFLLHSKTWEEEIDVEEGLMVNNKKKEEEEEYQRWIKEFLSAVRQKGRDMCLHEVVTMSMAQANEGDEHGVEERCPVIFGKEKVVDVSNKAVETAANVAVVSSNAVGTSRT